MPEGVDAALLRHPDRLRADGGVLVASAPERVPDTWAMRLMRSPLVARVYEGPWRSTLMRLVSPLSDALEDEIVDRRLAGLVRPTILELCCGTARAGRRWIARGGEVVGVDASLPMLREARRRCASERLVLVCGDARDRHARAGVFDAAICFASLHLVDSPSDVIDVAAECLRPGGWLFVWVLAARGAMRPRLVRTLSRSLEITPWPPGSLARMVAARLAVVEEASFGAVELVVAQSAGSPSVALDR